LCSLPSSLASLARPLTRSPARSSPGTGLGLAIAKHIVELAKGSIKFISDPTVKPGTVCVVECPFEACAPPARFPSPTMSSRSRPGRGGAPAPPVPPIEEKLNILIVDDVRMNRTMLKKRIQKFIAPNSTVQEAKNGEEALELVKTDTFDIMVVDQYVRKVAHAHALGRTWAPPSSFVPASLARLVA
jgi:hypothetical protein